MRATDLIDLLEDLIAKHGDVRVVSGVNRCGYGEAVIDAQLIEGCIVDDLGVVDLVLSEESLVYTDSDGTKAY